MDSAERAARGGIRGGVQAVAAAGMILGGAHAVEALDPDRLPLHSSPSQAAEFVYEHSLDGGDRKESLVINYQLRGTWYSKAAMGGLWGISPEKAKTLLGDLDTASGRQANERVTLYMTHNHSAELIKSLLMGTLEGDKIPRPNDLVLGPGGGDCVHHPTEVVGPQFQTDIVNIIVEPKAWWVCVSQAEGKDDNVIGPLRRGLAVATQTEPQERFGTLVHTFEQKYEESSGVRIQYLAPHASQQAIELAGEQLRERKR